MGARRFGPDVARFLQPDLFLGAVADIGLSNDPLTANRYALAAGNPLSFLEWDGHMLISDGGGGSDPSPNPTATVLRSTYTAIREGGTYAPPSSTSSAVSSTTPAPPVKEPPSTDPDSLVMFAARLGLQAGESVTDYVEGTGGYLNRSADEIFARAGYGFSSNRAAQSWIARSDIMRSDWAAKLARSGAFRVAGGALTVAGGVFTAMEHHAQGESWTKASVIGTSSALLSAGGATAGASTFGSLCVAFVVTAPFAPLCAGVGGVFGGVVGGGLGERIGEAITSEANPLTIENQAEGWTSLILPSFG